MHKVKMLVKFGKPIANIVTEMGELHDVFIESIKPDGHTAIVELSLYWDSIQEFVSTMNECLIYDGYSLKCKLENGIVIVV